MTRYDVRLEGITKRFDDVVAVNDVSIDIEPGEFLTLLGPSGCGKTTTLRMIAGLETPTEGTVYIGGEPVNGVPPFERDTGMVFQSYALFPHMTVGENVAFGLQMMGEGAGGLSGEGRSLGMQLQRLVRRGTSPEIDDRVSQMLELVELPGMMDRGIDQLSGGQQQRVALARALITEPTVLLLDEPLGALDLKLRKNMQIELQNLQSELETTFVYVTHDQEEALTMSDKIVVMNDGRIEQIGGAAEIYEEPETQFVADFIGETNLVHGRYERRDGSASVVSDRLAFEVVPHDGASGEVAFAVRPEKIRVGESAEGLDNVFEAEVVDEIYKGNVGKFFFRLENGETLTADVQLTDRSRSLSLGRSVTIGWSAENSVVLPE
jgi:ABC-type Fe3+/spermidine/putrescine transport system ATPase subunit